jgi:hypothetical protein
MDINQGTHVVSWMDQLKQLLAIQSKRQSTTTLINFHTHTHTHTELNLI